MDSQSNQKTLDVYQRHFDRYIDNTVQQMTIESFQGTWIRDVLARLTAQNRILEIGSAFGRDAVFMQQQGFKPELTDAFDAAVTYLNEHDLPAKKLNILTDAPDGRYDLVLACAVFLHFTEAELRQVLQTISCHLNPAGTLAFSVKKGNGEVWDAQKMGEPRYFHFWQQDQMKQLLSAEGFTVDDVRETDDGKWLHFITKVDS